MKLYSGATKGSFWYTYSRSAALECCDILRSPILMFVLHRGRNGSEDMFFRSFYRSHGFFVKLLEVRGVFRCLKSIGICLDRDVVYFFRGSNLLLVADDILGFILILGIICLLSLVLLD